MNRQLELQEEFQLLGDQTVGKRGYIPTIKERTLRLKLALEELGELAEAYGLDETFCKLLKEKIEGINKLYIKRDFQPFDTETYDAQLAANATVDIAVINNGTIITQGQHYTFDENYEIVDAKNKTKFLSSIEEARDLVDELKGEEPENDFAIGEKVVNGRTYYFVKDTNGKIRKSLNFEAEDLIL